MKAFFRFAFNAALALLLVKGLEVLAVAAWALWR